MASVLQVNEIKDSGGNATGITVADSSANVTINNLTGTTIAGTLASNITHSVGWQHLASFHHTSSDTDTEYMIFDNIFNNSYMAYCCHVGYINCVAHPGDLKFRFREGGASGSDMADASYHGEVIEYSYDSDNFRNTIHSGNNNHAPLINNFYAFNNLAYGAHGHIYFYNVNAPTIKGTATGRGTKYSPYIKSTFLHYHSSAGVTDGFGGSEAYFRFNNDHDPTVYTGFKLWTTNSGDTANSNLVDGTYASVYGLKGQATS